VLHHVSAEQKCFQHNAYLVKTYERFFDNYKTMAVITQSIITETQYCKQRVNSRVCKTTDLVSASSDGREMFHLYAANRRISAHELFILYDLRGWIVSFCTVSMPNASSSWSNTCQHQQSWPT